LISTVYPAAAARSAEVRQAAIHEAGHAAFMWRGGETLYGERFDERFALFDESTHKPRRF
jgi:hypothetical protein